MEFKSHLIGWVLFAICAVFFIVSSARSGDNWALLASVVFLIACFVFMLPLVVSVKSQRDE